MLTLQLIAPLGHEDNQDAVLATRPRKGVGCGSMSRAASFPTIFPLPKARSQVSSAIHSPFLRNNGKWMEGLERSDGW